MRSIGPRWSTGRSAHAVKFFLGLWATIASERVYCSPSTPTMERIREADRSVLIRLSTLAFALLALISFALARVAG